MKLFRGALAGALAASLVAASVWGVDSWRDWSNQNDVHPVSDRWPLPVRQGLIWSDTVNITVDSCATGANRIQDISAVGYLYLSDGGVFTDKTAEANSAGANDVDPWPAAPAQNDAVYYGSATQFNSIRMQIGTQGSTIMTVVWEYFSSVDNAWKTLTNVRQDVVDYDETVATHTNHFAVPADWGETTVNSVSAYWVRQRVSAYTSHTTNALLTQMWLGLITSNPAHQVVIKAWPDETETLVCDADGTAGLDDGFPIDVTAALVFEVNAYSYEIFCCGVTGTMDIAAALFNDGV